MEGASFEASLDLALKAAEFFRLTASEATERARTMAQRLTGSWQEEVRHQGVSGVDLRMLAPAFEHDETEKALSL